MLRARNAGWAAAFCEALQDEEGQGAQCLQEAAAAGKLLDDEGWSERPSWRRLFAGARPPPPRSVETEDEEEEEGGAEPGEWRHGWQYSACSVRETRFREQQLMPRLSRASRALLRSGAGPGAGAWLTTLPVSQATTLRRSLFQVALRQRLRLPLLLGTRRCAGRRCGATLDRHGDHLTGCSRTGLLQRRVKPLERAWTQVLLEAGGRVVPQQLLADMDVALESTTDGRRVDVVAYGLPVFGGLPVCADATLVSPLHCDGTPWRGADAEDGLRLRAARHRKEVVYPELVGSARAKLVVLAHEVGRRLAPEALRLLRRLACFRCCRVPALLQRSAKVAWHRRWICSVSMAAQSALAATLAEPAALWTAGALEAVPPAAASRLPLR